MSDFVSHTHARKYIIWGVIKKLWTTSAISYLMNQWKSFLIRVCQRYLDLAALNWKNIHEVLAPKLPLCIEYTVMDIIHIHVIMHYLNILFLGCQYIAQLVRTIMLLKQHCRLCTVWNHVGHYVSTMRFCSISKGNNIIQRIYLSIKHFIWSLTML